jgi:hypothetical protein
MIHDQINHRLLIATVLQDLEIDAEAVLDLARALENQASGTGSTVAPQKLREMAALVKSAALALLMAAANVVGVTERLTLIATIAEVNDSGSGELPS